MWGAVFSIIAKIVPSLLKISDKALDVKALKKATSKLVQELEVAEKDGVITPAEWLKILARFVEQAAIAVQAVQKQ
jgi:predicted RNA-binding protein associated with RNAse of E/G family